eukprot:s1603_g20.t1
MTGMKEHLAQSKLRLVILEGSDSSDADNHPVEASLGCHLDERKLFYTQKVNGIFGLAPHGITGRSNVLKDLFKDKAHVNTAVFAICLAEWGGELSVGGYDTRYAALGARMQWLPLHHAGLLEVVFDFFFFFFFLDFLDPTSFERFLSCLGEIVSEGGSKAECWKKPATQQPGELVDCPWLQHESKLA